MSKSVCSAKLTITQSQRSALIAIKSWIAKKARYSISIWTNVHAQTASLTTTEENVFLASFQNTSTSRLRGASSAPKTRYMCWEKVDVFDAQPTSPLCLESNVSNNKCPPQCNALQTGHSTQEVDVSLAICQNTGTMTPKVVKTAPIIVFMTPRSCPVLSVLMAPSWTKRQTPVRSRR